VKPAVQGPEAAVGKILIWSKKMTESRDMITVHVNVEITAASLQTIVENVKQLAGRDEKGMYRVDTANKVSEMISRFLQDNDFENYVKDIKKY
jgi:ribosome maturation factor RimP